MSTLRFCEVPAFINKTMLIFVLILLCVRECRGNLSPPGEFPPTCDGCFCVIDDDATAESRSGSVGTCPPLPVTEFNFTEQLKAMTWKNPIHLGCNPYPYAAEEGCTLTDSEGNAIEDDFGPDAVCGILYDESDIEGTCMMSYTTQSFASRQEMNAAGYTITHTGACGVCSSTQDLAVYIETPDLQGAGATCAAAALSNMAAALECYEAIGFSPSCAAAWLYDSANTVEYCLNICLQFFNQPPNLDDPGCPLNDCIFCNEEESGPYFKQFAGRTRRGSGLLSYIVRNCSEIVYDVAPVDPCFTVEEEEEDGQMRIPVKMSFLLVAFWFALKTVV